MNFLIEAFAWLADPTHWGGPNGIGVRLGEHLAYWSRASRSPA